MNCDAVGGLSRLIVPSMYPSRTKDRLVLVNFL
jgi:hypothetical protein